MYIVLTISLIAVAKYLTKDRKDVPISAHSLRAPSAVMGKAWGKHSG